WAGSIRIDGDVAAEITRLKSGDGPDIQIWGSSEVMQALTAAGLIDEYRIWIFPLVLGRGKRLFKDGLPARALALADTTTSSTGVVITTYRPAGEVKPGSFASDTPSDAELARRRNLAGEARAS